MDINFKQIQDFFNSISNITIGAFGGAVYYLYFMSKNNLAFETGLFIINIFVGGFMGYVFASFLPADITAHDGIIALSGAMGFKIMEFIEHNFSKILFEKIFHFSVKEEPNEFTNKTKFRKDNKNG